VSSFIKLTSKLYLTVYLWLQINDYSTVAITIDHRYTYLVFLLERELGLPGWLQIGHHQLGLLHRLFVELHHSTRHITITDRISFKGRSHHSSDLISTDLISSKPSSSERAMKRPSTPRLRPIRRQDSATYFVLIGRSLGELGRFTVPVSSDEMRSVEMRCDKWYELTLLKIRRKFTRNSNALVLTANNSASYYNQLTITLSHNYTGLIWLVGWLGFNGAFNTI